MLRASLPFFPILLVLMSQGASCNIMNSKEDRPPIIHVRIGEEFVLGIHGQAVVDDAGLYMEVLGVPTDSRCPQGATCVWAGEVAVSIEVRKGNNEKDQFELKLSPDPKEASRRVGENNLKLLRVLPYPQLNRTIQPNEYRATFIVD